MHVGPRCRPARARSRSRSDSGGVAVEFALVLPLLVMLLLGTVTAGLTYSNGIGLSNAVREGARFGATGTFDPLTPANWRNDVTNRIRATQFDDAGTRTAICLRLWKQSAAGGAPVLNSTQCSQGNYGTPALATSDPTFPTAPSGLATDTCVVQVLAARKFTITLGIFPSISGTLKRRSVARYERSPC